MSARHGLAAHTQSRKAGGICRRLSAGIALALALLAAASAQQGGGNQPGTKWSDQQLRQTVDLARVGRKLTPKSWPNGELYKDEFDGAYAEGTTFILTLHPYLSGHRAPMRHLEGFVKYMKSKPGVWFATCEQVARYVKDGK